VSESSWFVVDILSCIDRFDSTGQPKVTDKVVRARQDRLQFNKKNHLKSKNKKITSTVKINKILTLKE
jgi:hypothetical protein